MAILAYKNDSELKSKFVDQMRWHQDQDRIVQGSYGENGKSFRGCAVGCGIHSMAMIHGMEFDNSNHKLWEELIGIPEWIARVCDSVFEGLPDEEARKFPVQFSESVKCGKDLDSIKPAFSIFVLESVRGNARDDGGAAIDQVISLYRRVQNGEEVTDSEWSAAESAARSAAESAAWSAAESAAWSAARSAAWSAAESAAESAAWSAARSAAESAWSAAWIKFRNELLRLVAE